MLDAAFLRTSGRDSECDLPLPALTLLVFLVQQTNVPTYMYPCHRPNRGALPKCRHCPPQTCVFCTPSFPFSDCNQGDFGSQYKNTYFMQNAQEIGLCWEREFSQRGHAACHRSSKERHHAKEMERCNHGISGEKKCRHVVLSVQTRQRPEVQFSAAGKTT